MIKKIVVIISLACFFFCNVYSVEANSRREDRPRHRYQQKYKKHDRHRDEALANLGAAVGGAFVGGIIGYAFGKQQQVVVVQPQQPVNTQSPAVQKRILEHEIALQEYYECRDKYEVDRMYGTSHRNAIDCSELHPQYKKWKN